MYERAEVWSERIVHEGRLSCRQSSWYLSLNGTEKTLRRKNIIEIQHGGENYVSYHFSGRE